MNVIVAGLGVVGHHVATVLDAEKHNLILLDRDEHVLEGASETIDAMTIQGDVVSAGLLRQAGVETCDLFVAVTDRDEVNIIGALRAKHLGAKKAIARVTQRVYFEGEHGLYNDMFGIDLVVNPKFLVALEIHKLIRTHGALAVEDFANNQIEMVQIPIDAPSKGTNRPLKDVRLPADVNVVGIVRHGRLTIPGGGDKIQVGDEAICIGRVDAIPQAEQLFGLQRRHDTRYVVIVGGGDIGLALARQLQADSVDVRLIEQDRARCLELQELLHGRHMEILNGDGTSSQLLQELALRTCDVFVAVSHEDEVNLMASLLAKELGAQRCISLVHKPDYTPILKRLGIDSTLSPRVMVAREVLKHVRQAQVLTVAQILGGQGEFLEISIRPQAHCADRLVSEVNWPVGSRVCAGFGAQGAYIAHGGTRLRPGDRVVVITSRHQRKALEQLF